MSNPMLYGTPLSTFVRTARMTLMEKGVEYDHVDVGVLDGECNGAEHRARNPFGKVPAFEHEGLVAYETNALVRYIDQAFEGPMLTPPHPRDQLRMNQIMSIHDNHGYDALILDTVAYFFFPDFIGGQDDARLNRGREVSATVLAEIERLMGDSAYLAGGGVSLADLYVAPSYFYLSLSPVADEMLAPRKKLQAWWERMGERESLAATEPQMG